MQKEFDKIQIPSFTITKQTKNQKTLKGKNRGEVLQLDEEHLQKTYC